MKIVSLGDVEGRLRAYLEQCATEGPIVIIQNDKVVAVLLVPEDDYDLERLILGRSPHFQAMLDKSRQSVRAGRLLSEEDFWEAVEQQGQE